MSAVVEDAARRAPPPGDPPRPARGARRARAMLLGAVLAVAMCGFVYELLLISLGTYLIGNSITQVSIVLAAFVSSMGLGSLAAKSLQRRPLEAFVVVEAAVALIGGTSALVLYAAFAWLDLYQPAMVGVAVVVGFLVGAEIPLLLCLMQRVRREAAGTSVADLLAADYLGAVVAGVGFPLLILPFLGQLGASLAVGIVNALAGLLVLWVFRRTLRIRRLALLAGSPLAAIAALALLAALAGPFEATARQRLYDDPIVHAERTRYQNVVVTERKGDLRLFLNGDLQFSSRDEHRYHESLVHPALAGPRRSILILGGGDGLALREALRYRDVQRVVLVELDPRMLALARGDPRLRRLNGASLSDPRVEPVAADAFAWLREAGERFDVVIADLPDPEDASLAKLYSVEMYEGIRRRALRPGGRLVVQAGSPYFAPEAFWSIEASLRRAGLAVRPYHVDVPSFGDWGFVLARAEARPPLTLDPPGRLRFLDRAILRAAAHFPRDRRRLPVLPSTLNRPRILEYERRGWQDY